MDRGPLSARAWRVFASAIGLFELCGSVLRGRSSDIHLLVACRVLQGCGGAMMVPVGRLTLVRSFAKSELIRTMSFVAIPALVGPMLGPVVGGLIVRYFHWRAIFFLNLPIGLYGLGDGLPAPAGFPRKTQTRAGRGRADLGVSAPASALLSYVPVASSASTP